MPGWAVSRASISGGLDAEAADLDLVVRAADELQLAVGAQRTMSPVQYMRVPGGPKGSAT